MTTTGTPMADAAHLPFSRQIREATRDEHEAAEGVGDLMSGALPLEHYVTYVSQLYLVYEALERAGARLADDPVAGAFVSDDLARVPALEVDLAGLLGDGWRARIDVLPATEAYRRRLDEVGRDWPGGFVAHHYTRYLGDLSGGRILGRAIRDTYGFGDGPGATFTTFDRIPEPNRTKVDYRRRLDAVPWDLEERDAVVEEARQAFRHNRALFADLDRHRSSA